MRAVTWEGLRDVRVTDVPDPRIEEPGDAVVRITSSAICGSDLHLYEGLGTVPSPGDVLGHEALGVVEEVGAEAGDLAPGDRVVIPFQVCCGRCWMCRHDLQSQCETTQVRAQGSGAALFGHSELYGSLPGAQAQYLRVPHAAATHVTIPPGPPDDRFLYLSDVLPTAWQALEYATLRPGDTLFVLGLGPIGDMACRVARQRGVGDVLAVDLVDARLARARERGITTLDARSVGDVAAAVLDLTGGRGADAVIDAVGMGAHGPGPALRPGDMALAPGAVDAPAARTSGVDRLAALTTAIAAVRRGGTISLAGVYGGAADPLPMVTLFDKQVTLRMGRANVMRWVPRIMPLLTDQDPLGVDHFATHHLGLDDAPGAYASLDAKEDDMVKVVLHPDGVG